MFYKSKSQGMLELFKPETMNSSLIDKALKEGKGLENVRKSSEVATVQMLLEHYYFSRYSKKDTENLMNDILSWV